MTEMTRDLLLAREPGLSEEQADDRMAARQLCKVEDCENPLAAKLGPYGGLCAEHAEEKKAERKMKQLLAPKRKRKTNAQLREEAIAARAQPPTGTVPPSEQITVDDVDRVLLGDGQIRVRDRKSMEELLHDLVMTDDDDLDLAAMRIDAARLLLAAR